VIDGQFDGKPKWYYRWHKTDQTKPKNVQAESRPVIGRCKDCALRAQNRLGDAYQANGYSMIITAKASNQASTSKSLAYHTGLVATEKNFRKLIGYKLLWMLQAYLDESTAGQLVEKRNVG
jgi:hypothetical protein